MGEPSNETDEASATTGSSGGETSGVETSTSSIETGTGDPGTESGPALVPYDCRTLLAAEPQSPSGSYRFTAPNTGMAYEAYCDMDIDGGGWTLVGRSDDFEGESPNFGFFEETGTLSNSDAPYALDIERVELTFDEILIGTRGEGYEWGDYIYRIEVDPDFVWFYRFSPLETTHVTAVRLPCTDNIERYEVVNLGFTRSTSRFAFSDNDPDDGGLRARGFADFRDECGSQGANLDGTHGMIFVR